MNSSLKARWGSTVRKTNCRWPRRAKTTHGEDVDARLSRPLPHDEVDFAHNSERQFARLLDFYMIDWLYEPTTFDIAWDSDGKPTQRFAPDFYLPEFDLYIEITTLNQKLVTKKNRKIRRLTTLYPDVRCKILYQRDYLNLLIKYGLEGPEEADDAAGEDGDATSFGSILAG